MNDGSIAAAVRASLATLMVDTIWLGHFIGLKGEKEVSTVVDTMVKGKQVGIGCVEVRVEEMWGNQEERGVLGVSGSLVGKGFEWDA